MGKKVTDYLLYRWRYILGYSLIGLMVIAMLAVAGLFIPGGLSHSEMQSVVASNSLSFSLSSLDPQIAINLPYHLLQRISLDIFGVSTFSIKLPSLLLGLLSVAGMLILLRTWFRENIAVLTTVLVITTGQFLFVAQSGTPSIVYIFWSVWLLVAAMMVSRKAKWSTLWKLVLFGIAALSLYTPFSAYILLALASSTVLHPHLRYLIRRLSKARLILAVIFALLLVAPLGYMIFKNPSVGLTLLGVPHAWPDLQANIVQLLNQYFNFLSPSSGLMMTPTYGLGSVILIILGVVRLFTTKYTARSYIISAWIILLIPVLITNPNYVSVTFVPVMLLMAMGVSMLLSSWYRLFPRNPYARLAGLIPLIILVGGMVLSGVDRYMYGYLYDPQTANNFSQDLKLLNNQLSEPDRGKTTLVTTSAEAPFYSVVAHHNHDVTVAAEPASPPADASTVIVSHDAHQTDSSPMLYRIATDSTSHDADRFYIYKTDAK